MIDELRLAAERMVDRYGRDALDRDRIRTWLVDHDLAGAGEDVWPSPVDEVESHVRWLLHPAGG